MRKCGLMKKFLAVAASVCLTLGCFSGAAFADGEEYVPAEGYLEISSTGYDAQLDFFFFCMNQSWSWIQPGTTGGKFVYGTPAHMSLAAPEDEAALFEDSENLTRIGFRIGYFTDVPELTAGTYDIKFNIGNLTFNFDGYDPLVIEGLNNDNVEWDNDATVPEGSSGLIFVESYFPDLTAAADMMRHLVSIEFDYYVYYLGATGLEGVVAQPEETSEDATEEVPEETSTEEPEETEKEETTEEETTEEETTEEETTEEETTEEEKSSEAASTQEETTASAAEDSDDDGSNVKLIVTIVASVILVGALAAVAVVYVKKSKIV